jgi:hypothetical protein
MRTPIFTRLGLATAVAAFDLSGSGGNRASHRDARPRGQRLDEGVRQGGRRDQGEDVGSRHPQVLRGWPAGRRARLRSQDQARSARRRRRDVDRPVDDRRVDPRARGPDDVQGHQRGRLRRRQDVGLLPEEVRGQGLQAQRPRRGRLDLRLLEGQARDRRSDEEGEDLAVGRRQDHRVAVRQARAHRRAARRSRGRPRR